MEYVLLLFALSVFVVWFMARRSAMDSCEWYVVIKYTDQDYLGEQVDAHFVNTSSEALYRTSRGPMKPGEKLRGFWVMNDSQRAKAIALHEQRVRANRNFALLMEHVDEQWTKASERARH